MTHTSVKPPPAARGHDALSALLETEHALRERLGAARAEAARIIEEATTRAQAAEAAMDATIARELAEFDAAHAASVRSELDAIAARAREDAARFTAVSDTRARELAALAADRVFGT